MPTAIGGYDASADSIAEVRKNERKRVRLALPNLRHLTARTRDFLEIGRGAGVALRVRMTVDPSTFNDITRGILAAAIEVHRTLGPGLLESTYLECLEYELAAYKLGFERQRTVPIVYKGIALSASYRIDLIVEDRVVVEVKSVKALAPVHWAQVLTYLRLTGCPAGLLINFNVARVMEGVKRVLNPHYEAKRDIGGEQRNG